MRFLSNMTHSISHKVYQYIVAFPASGRRILGGSAELDEYDIVRLLPTPAAGTGGPDEPPRQEKRKKRSAVGSSSQYWPDARVPYDFASNMRK